MAEQNTTPEILAQIKSLQKDVYELKRRALPPTAGGGDDLWQQIGGVLTVAKDPSNINIGSSDDVSISAPTHVLVSSPTLVTIQSNSEIALTASVLDVDARTRWTFTVDPSGAPLAGFAFIWVRDSGGGKAQLVWRPPTGGMRVIDTEP